MIEDKLTHDERLRLECLAQAQAKFVGVANTSPEKIIDVAERYERFIKSANVPRPVEQTSVGS